MCKIKGGKLLEHMESGVCLLQGIFRLGTPQDDAVMGREGNCDGLCASSQ